MKIWVLLLSENSAAVLNVLQRNPFKSKVVVWTDDITLKIYLESRTDLIHITSD